MKTLDKITSPADEWLHGIDVQISRLHHGGPHERDRWATRLQAFRQGCFRTYQHGSVVFHSRTNRRKKKKKKQKGLLAWRGSVPLPARSPPLAPAL